MKKRTSFKYINIYTFIIILSLIGFTCGIKYYDYQTHEYKEELKEKIDIQKTIENTPYIKQNIKNSFLTLLNSSLLITNIFNICQLFYEPFTIGFIYSLIKSINKNIALPYILIYKLIPLLINLIEIRIGFTISKNIVIFILNKGNKIYKKHIITLLKKYCLFFLLKIIYIIFLLFFHHTIIAFLFKML